MLTTLGLALAGLVAGMYGTIVGAGGGFILVPLLLLTRPDLSAAGITTISLGSVFFNSMSGSAAYARQHRVDFKTGLLLAAATVPTSALGAILVGFVPRRPFQLMFGAFLVLVAIFVWIRPGIQRRTVRSGARFHRRLTDARGNTYEWSYNLILALGASFIIGFLAALLGVGGGVMLVPVMVTFLSFPPAVATATSTFVLLFTSLSATATHLVQGDFRGVEVATLAVAAGTIAGAQLGARISQRLSSRLIVRLLAAALAFVGGRLFLSGVL